MTAKILQFPAKHVEHEHCPKCGNRNGPFERLGSGICNECLSKRVKRREAANKKRGNRDA